MKSVVRDCTGVERTLIATRGDLLVLYHQVVRGETTAGFAWEIETLAIGEINDDDLITETVIFDADDLDGADGRARRPVPRGRAARSSRSRLESRRIVRTRRCAGQ